MCMDTFVISQMSMVIKQYPLSSIDVHRYSWMSLDVHRYPWTFLDTHKYNEPMCFSHHWLGLFTHDNDGCFHYDKMQVLLPADIAMISAMQQQTFYEHITAADYCKLQITSKTISKAFAPLCSIVMLTKCHGLKNAGKGELKQQCTRAPRHLIAESGVHVCGNHANKSDKSTVWSVPIGRFANIQQRVVDMIPQVGNAEAHSMIPIPYPTPSHPTIPSSSHFEKLENIHVLFCDSQTYIVSLGIPNYTLLPSEFQNANCLPRDPQTYVVSLRFRHAHCFLKDSQAHSVPQWFPNIHCSPVIPKHTLFPQKFLNMHRFPKDSQTYIVSQVIPKHTMSPQGLPKHTLFP